MINGKHTLTQITGKAHFIRRFSASLLEEVTFTLKWKQEPAEKVWPADKEAEGTVYAKALQ